MSTSLAIDAPALTRFTEALLHEAGVPVSAAEEVAAALVEADAAGIASHGVMLLPQYLARIAAGSIQPHTRGSVLSRNAGAIVLDAEDGLGQVVAGHAVALALEAARAYGSAAVAVRQANHFGAAGRWARQIAQAGAIGIVFSNTRPLMPPPGGAQAVVGNNPLAIAVPAGDGVVVLDMALSQTAMGRIRMAAAAGMPIPPDWATDAAGAATTDPKAAIAGMLLPTGGAKGFGLAVMADLIAAGLSGGAPSTGVVSLYADPAVPYRCSQFFLALDIAAFRALPEFLVATGAFADEVRTIPPVAGADSPRMPGDRATAAQHEGRCHLAVATIAALRAEALARNVPLPAAFTA